MFQKSMFFVLLVCVAFVTLGCGDPGGTGPTKPAGPGGTRQQPYNPADGTYK